MGKAERKTIDAGCHALQPALAAVAEAAAAAADACGNRNLEFQLYLYFYEGCLTQPPHS